VSWSGKALERYPAGRGRAAYATVYHWRRVAKWRGLTWEYFRKLAPDDQAGYIAEYETEAHLDHLEAEHAKQQAKQRAKRRATSGRSRI
jgi:hypothetical protein